MAVSGTYVVNEVAVVEYAFDGATSQLFPNWQPVHSHGGHVCVNAALAPTKVTSPSMYDSVQLVSW